MTYLESMTSRCRSLKEQWGY